MLAAEKPAGTYRIFLFGESAAPGRLVPPMESGVTWKSCCASVFRERILNVCGHDCDQLTLSFPWRASALCMKAIYGSQYETMKWRTPFRSRDSFG